MSRNNLKEWYIRLLAVRVEYYTRTFPNVAKDGLIPDPKPYRDDTSGGLARCIIDFINFSGYDCRRINTMGIPRKGKDGRVKWTKGGGRRGEADLQALLPGGFGASIEIKIGADTPSPEQIKERARITNAGGQYFTAKDFTSFLQWWDNTTALLTHKTSANA